MAKNFHSISNKKLLSMLKNGAIGVLPTDTIYGLVCLAANEEATIRLYSVKNRENKTGTIIAFNIEQLVKLGMKYRYLKAVEQYWPGAISIEIPFTDTQTNYLRQGLNCIAVRLPSDKRIINLLKQTGPLLTTSANQPDKPTANTTYEAQDYFGNKVDFYVDGGNLSGRKPSTIIKIVDDAVEVIRNGEVKIN